MVAELEPQEQGELKQLLQQFMDRYTRVENEMELLKEDAKSLLEEFEDRLDTKTLKAAIRIVRAKRKIKHQDTFERYESVLDDLETL